MSNDHDGSSQSPWQQPAPPGAGTPIPPPQQQPYPQPGTPSYGQPYAQPYGQLYGQPYAAPPRSNGLALAAMICGIVSVVLCWAYLVLPLLAGIPAVIMGHLSLKKLKADPTLGGRGLALTGLITGYIGIGLGLIIGAIIIAVFVFAFSMSSTYG